MKSSVLLFLLSLSSFIYSQDSAFMFGINNLKMPMNNAGSLGDVNINGKYGATFNNTVVIYSSGFWLSGKVQNDTFANGVFPSQRTLDYLPGSIGSGIKGIYVVKQTDLPFSESWLQWKNAVKGGADFYDGNNDGVYDPVDLNNNGKWDANEDKPFLLGSLTAWTVYNDNVPSEKRWFKIDSLGIEIQQSMFGWQGTDHTSSNIVFVRYKIVNKSYTKQQFDSVYFSVTVDPDLGYPYDDLIGSDTLMKAGMCYNDSSDRNFGTATPALMFQLLQGPQVYIPGVTFTDINSNGVYDDGVDTPLDSAVAKLGPDIGIKKYYGARNLGMTSSIFFQKADPTVGEPMKISELRNYQKGYTIFGKPVDPCSWNLGTVFGEECSAVNNKYWYSGDPVTKKGWLNVIPNEQRVIVNSGPFNIPYEKSVDIIAAYIVGSGTDALNSITRARDVAAASMMLYDENFSQIIIGIKDEDKVVNNYQLDQNYPNPFNPTTVIKYSLPHSGMVSLKVYDVLGNEVSVLVNEIKNAGKYEVKFNASSLSSGVYFYKLESGSFVETKKLMLLK